jgi:ribosomal protein S18 acetylase RimI-like enzyme
MPVDACDVGSRVVVRSRLGGRGPGGGPAVTDVVGLLEQVDDKAITVRRRDGVVTRIPMADVVAAKRISRVAPRAGGRGLRVEPEELQRITDSGWPAPVREHLGEWLLRAAGGFTGRANSVSVHGEPGRPLASALRAVTDFYAAAQLPAMAQVVVGSRWERSFDAAGWITKPGGHAGALVQVAAVRTALRSAGEPRRADPVQLDSHVSDDWLALYNRAGDRQAAVVRAVLEGPDRVVFARLGEPLRAIGRLVVDGDWAGIAAVEVAPEHRGRGLARLVVDALLRRADVMHARWCYLQTMPANAAALGLYGRYGFTTHHTYRYLVPADQEQMTVSAGV